MIFRKYEKCCTSTSSIAQLLFLITENIFYGKRFLNNSWTNARIWQRMLGHETGQDETGHTKQDTDRDDVF